MNPRTLHGGGGGVKLLLHWIEESGQLHATAALAQGKALQVAVIYEVCAVPDPVWKLWKRQKFLGRRSKQESSVKQTAIEVATSIKPFGPTVPL